MSENQKTTRKEIHFNLNEHEAVAVWKAIRFVVDNNVPATPAEDALLMQSMSKLAVQIDKYIKLNEKTSEIIEGVKKIQKTSPLELV